MAAVAKKRWAKKWDCCQECGGIERPHSAKGLCKLCDLRRRRRENLTFCCDCGARIQQGSSRCCSCQTRQQWKEGVHETRSTPEYLEKKSVAAKQAWERGCYPNMSQFMKERWESGEFHELQTDEWRQKLSEARKRQWKRGDFGGPEWIEKMRQATKKGWESGRFDGAFQSPSSIELEVCNALKKAGVGYVPQFRPEGYSRPFDVLVPPNILIEVQGDYWHSEEHKPGIREKDARKAKWAQKHGYKLVEIWEHEINEHGAQKLIEERVTWQHQ